MSLLQKASIITTPTAYAEDYLYSIKPAQSLGSELVTNGTFDTDSDWTKSSGWTISGGKANRSGVSTNSYVSQDFNVIAGRNYIVKYDRTYVSGGGQTNLFSYFVSGSTRTTRGNYEDTTQETVTVTDYFKPEHSGNLSLRVYGIGTFTGSIDNVSIKEITDADFDFDRNSTGTRVNEDYLIEDVPYNAINFSEDFTQWSLNGDSVVLQDETYLGRPIYKLTESSSSTLGVHQTRTGNMVGSPYTISLIAKKDTSSFIRLRFGSSINKNVDFNLDTGVVTSESSGVTGAIQNIGNGFYQLSSVLASSTNATISYAIYSSNGSVFITSAQMVKGDKLKDYLKTTDRLDIPRIDYTNGEPSILLEPQRQNLITYSQDFTQWGNARTTDTANQITSPDGLNNGTLLEQQSGQTTAGSIFFSVSLSSGTYTQSIYAKKKDKNFIVGYDANAARTYFNLETGKVGTVASGVTAKMIAMPNGWYRCIITYTITTGAVIAFYLSDNGTAAPVTDSGGVYIYGAQLEAGSYATSLIHTSGSAVTRSADTANNAGNSDLFNDSEGVLYIEAKSTYDSSNSRRISISDGTIGNRVSFEFDETTQNTIKGFISSGGATQATLTHSAIDLSEYNKMAIKYKANDFSLFFNGTEVNVDATGSAPTGLNSLQLEGGANANDMYGNVKSVMVFKEALTDLELEKLTGYNNHELYMNYYNRLSYLGLVEEYNVESDINNYIL